MNPSCLIPWVGPSLGTTRLGESSNIPTWTAGEMDSQLDWGSRGFAPHSLCGSLGRGHRRSGFIYLFLFLLKNNWHTVLY